MKLTIYLADLFHDYLGAKQFVPINIGYVGAYCAARFGHDISIELFKSPDELLDAIDKQPPHILGLSDYTWNSALNEFVAKQAKSRLLVDSGYLRKGTATPPTQISFEIDSLAAQQIREFFTNLEAPVTLFFISQILQMNWGRTYLEVKSEAA
jgi:hypothetical protein